MLAALSDSDQDRSNLLGAARALTEATVKLLNSSKPENIEVCLHVHYMYMCLYYIFLATVLHILLIKIILNFSFQFNEFIFLCTCKVMSAL